LTESGRFLREQKAGVEDGQHQRTLERVAPVAHDRFSAALDQLESQVRQAQTVLRRDLALMQADRLKREREEAERARLAAATIARRNGVATKEDVTPRAAATASEPAISTTQAKTSPQDAKPSVDHHAKESPQAISTSDAPPDDAGHADATATATAQDEFDFDAMFGESLGDGGEDQEHSHDEGNANQDNSASDLNFNLDDQGPSLLRGLEDFAKSGDDDGVKTEQGGGMKMEEWDTSMPDLPDLSINQESNTANPVKNEGTSTAQQPAQNSDNGDVVMGNDDLDDLFNMDYENPETTEFDNAFFGFDES
jgi:hypothetical protein